MDGINAWCSLNECCEFLGGPQMNVVNSWRSPDGCY